MKKILLVLSAAVLLFSACKKDDDEPEDTTSVTLKNVSGNYNWTGYLISQGPLTYDAFPELVDACAKDDIISLKEDKTYSWPDGGVKCTGSQDQNGSWDLVGTTQFKLDNETLNIDRFDVLV